MIKEISILTKHNQDHHSVRFGRQDQDKNDYIEDDFELPVDIARRGRHLIIITPIVGVAADDVNITINNDVLFIHKNNTTTKDKIDSYYIKECHWGAISREIRLPQSVDPIAAKAELLNGVLKIIVPIIEKKKTKIIKIK